MFQKEEIEPLQVKQQDVNWLGQGLIQSAAKGTSTQALEHDLDSASTRWKTLNKKVTSAAPWCHFWGLFSFFKLIDNDVSVSGAQHSLSGVCVRTFVLVWVLFHSRFLHGVEHHPILCRRSSSMICSVYSRAYLLIPT